MATNTDHFAQALESLQFHDDVRTDQPAEATRSLTEAQVHATLAIADVLQQFLDFAKAQDAEAIAEVKRDAGCPNPGTCELPAWFSSTEHRAAHENVQV